MRRRLDTFGLSVKFCHTSGCAHYCVFFCGFLILFFFWWVDNSQTTKWVWSGSHILQTIYWVNFSFVNIRTRSRSDIGSDRYIGSVNRNVLCKLFWIHFIDCRFSGVGQGKKDTLKERMEERDELKMVNRLDGSLTDRTECVWHGSCMSSCFLSASATCSNMTPNGTNGTTD